MASYLCAQIKPRLSLPETTDNSRGLLPTIFHHPSPPQPSFLRKNYSFRVTCTQSPSATNLGAQESVASSSSLRDRWLPVSPIKNLDPNRPTLVYLLNRGIVVRVENVYNQWVVLLHEGTDYDILRFGDCRSPQASSDGPRFPVRESNGLLFLWPDEDGWEEAHATKLPSVKPTDIMASMMNGSIVITEVPGTDYNEDSMNEKSTDVPKPCCPCRGTSAKSSSDMKSTKVDSMNEKLIDAVPEPLDSPFKEDSMNEKSTIDVPRSQDFPFFVKVALQFLFVVQVLFQNKEINDLFAEFLKPHLINTLNSWSKTFISMLTKKFPTNPNLVAFITFAGMLMLFVAVKTMYKKKDNETTIK